MLQKLLFVGTMSVLIVSAAPGQDGVQTRSITSDDFASQRPAQPKTVGAAPRRGAIKRKPVKFRFVRAERSPIKGKAPANPAGANSPVKVTEMGVTIWKLRPPRRSEAGAFLLPVLDDNQERKMWIAERVPLDTVFTSGDRVRLAIESSDSGYLYIFGRETYADGSFGPPYPIFAGSKGSEFGVRPGMLFDIPDQREDTPYFKITPKRPDHNGELITIIVSPKPYEDLALDKNGELKNTEILSQLEFGSDVEIFSRADTLDKIFSKSESEATCGVKTRELVRESPAGAGPCGTRSRQLSREDALPQTIFRVRSQAGKPAVAFVKLAVKPGMSK